METHLHKSESGLGGGEGRPTMRWQSEAGAEQPPLPGSKPTVPAAMLCPPRGAGKGHAAPSLPLFQAGYLHTILALLCSPHPFSLDSLTLLWLLQQQQFLV